MKAVSQKSHFRQILSALLTCLFVTACGRFGSVDDGSASSPSLDCSSYTSYSQEGAGTLASPYIICNSKQLASIGSSSGSWSSYFKLTADINLQSYYSGGGAEFQIGSCGTGTCTDADGAEIAFSGSFDGNGKTINNYKYQKPANVGSGFFGKVQGAQIKNINFANLIVQGTGNTGGVIGYSVAATISNITSSGTVTGSSTGVGGLIGFASGGSVSNSTTSGTVNSSGFNVGGLIGSSSSPVSSSSSSASVQGTSSVVGGLIGICNSSVTDSFASGSVIGTSSTGGLIGQMNFLTLSKSYALGAVSGTSSIGGLVGRAESGGTIQKSYALGNLTGTSSAIGGLVGVVGNASFVLTIEDSYAKGNATTSAGSVGGLVGRAHTGNVVVRRSYATGNASTAVASMAGGLIGEVASTTVTIEDSFATGDVVSGTNDRLAYLTVAATVTNSYVYSGSFCSTCSSNQTGDYAAISDFYNVANTPLTNWDFTTIWQASGTSFPTLR